MIKKNKKSLGCFSGFINLLKRLFCCSDSYSVIYNNNNREQTIALIDKKTPQETLYNACRNYNHTKITQLIKEGIDINQLIDGNNNTALHLAIQFASSQLSNTVFQKYFELTKFLLQRGADPSIINKKGNTPLTGLYFSPTYKYNNAEYRKKLAKLLTDYKAKLPKNVPQEIIDLYNLDTEVDHNNKSPGNLSPSVRFNNISKTGSLITINLHGNK